jgi:quercetin dioxygenase-like cupin family protein
MNTPFDITSAVNHYFSDNVYIKQMECPAGYTVDTHKHKYDHLSILSKGTALVTIDDKPTMYTAPACINIEKNKTHTIVALEDMVLYSFNGRERYV